MRSINIFPDKGLRVIMAGTGEHIISKFVGSSDRIKIDLYNFFQGSFAENKIIGWNPFYPDGIELSDFETINNRFLSMIVSGGEQDRDYKIEIQVMMEDGQIWTIKLHLSVE